MSTNLSEGALVTYAIDEMVEAFDHLRTFTDVAQAYNPPSASLQRSANQWWKPLQQLTPTLDGWDIDGQEGTILELSVGGSLTDPANTFFQLRADDVRDETSYRRRIRANAVQLFAQMEQRGLLKAAQFGSLVLRDTSSIGTAAFGAWNALADSQDLIFSRQLNMTGGTATFLNSSDYIKAGGQLVDHDSFPGPIEMEAYRQGNIQRQVAGYDNVFKHNSLPRSGAQATVVTVNGAQTFDPIAFELSNSGSPVPFDNRYADLTVSTTVGVNVGDKFSVADLKAVSMMDKTPQDEDMTFTVVAIPDAATLTISPRPIALDDGSLSSTQLAYANVNTSFADADTLVWLNTADVKTNVFMVQDAMVIASSPIPASHELFSGMRTESFSVGPINGIIAFQGKIGDLTGRCRIAIWYEWQVEKPEAVGIILPDQT